MNEFFLKLFFIMFLGFGILSLTVISLDKSSFKSLSISGDLNNQQYRRAKEILIEFSERGSNSKILFRFYLTFLGFGK